ncbi:MAG: glutaredoxin family protein [Caldibacillus sp.]
MERSTLVLYTKPNCPLCEEAKKLLEEIEVTKRFRLIEKDITQDDALYEKYGLMIPVLEWQGEIIQYGNFVKKNLIFCLNRVNSATDD